MKAVHRVGELRLVVGAAEGREEAARAGAEAFTREVLERCGDLLEERFPGRLFFVRRLETRWSVSEERLGDAGEVDRHARELADGVEDAGRAEAPAEGSVAVFEDEADRRARYLAAQARGEGREWYFTDLRERGFSLSRLARDGAPGPVLERLADAGALAAVLAAAADGEVRELARALGLDVLPPGAGGEKRSAGPPAPPEVVAELERLARDLAGGEPAAARRLSPEALRLVLFVEARRRLGGAGRPGEAVEPGRVRAAVEAALARGEADVPRRPAAEPPEGPPPAAEAEPRPEPEALRLATAHGGLFYLLTLALELGLGELLWQACLPEGEALAEAFATLLGEDGAGDPALGLLAGPERSRGGGEPTYEQQREVARGALAALAAALPRRGLAALPETTLGLHGEGDGRTLALVAAGSPFPLLAWPAGSTEALREGLAALLAAWPASAPAPRAEPALAAAAARLRADEAATLPAALHLPEAGSNVARALAAQLAGAAAALFCARAGAAPGSAAELASGWLRFPAEVRVDAEAIAVDVDDRHVRVELRRAGLDRDPGWVPWLGRTVRLRFVGAEPE